MNNFDILNTLNIALIQSDIVWENRELNFIHHKELIDKIAKDVDIVMLPETFSTGFMAMSGKISETDREEIVEWMRATASIYNCVMCGSTMILENGKLFNRFYFVEPNGQISAYDKRHLFSFGIENQIFTAGNKRVIINYRGWKIFPQICYDLRFPVWQRNVWDKSTGYEYDLMLICANWPTSRIEVWKTLLRARAIENQCYVAGVNRVGCDGMGVAHNGFSTIIDFKGNVMAQEIENQVSIVTMTLDQSKLKQFRESFLVGTAQDPFTLL